jgi:hypothetical protein
MASNFVFLGSRGLIYKLIASSDPPRLKDMEIGSLKILGHIKKWKKRRITVFPSFPWV